MDSQEILHSPLYNRDSAINQFHSRVFTLSKGNIWRLDESRAWCYHWVYQYSWNRVLPKVALFVHDNAWFPSDHRFLDPFLAAFGTFQLRSCILIQGHVHWSWQVYCTRSYHYSQLYTDTYAWALFRIRSICQSLFNRVYSLELFGSYYSVDRTACVCFHVFWQPL